MFGEGDVRLCRLKCGESMIFDPSQLKKCIDEQVLFSQMFNQGSPVPRLVAIQSLPKLLVGESDQTIKFKPLYRHPNDEEPPNIEMVPIVLELLTLVEASTGIVGLNHVLIQKYREGKDNIQMHSDKTLDLSLSTPIINLSIGAERTMKLRKKENKSEIQIIPLRHLECLIFGLQTNQYWYHEVPKKMDIDPDPIFGCERISFTFRKVETFMADGECIIIGQGSRYATLSDYYSSGRDSNNVIDRDRTSLIKAFSQENKLHDKFDWKEVYGCGFLCR